MLSDPANELFGCLQLSFSTSVSFFSVVVHLLPNVAMLQSLNFFFSFFFFHRSSNPGFWQAP